MNAEVNKVEKVHGAFRVSLTLGGTPIGSLDLQIDTTNASNFQEAVEEARLALFRLGADLVKQFDHEASLR